MKLISVKHKGNFKKTDRFFKSALREDYLDVLDRYGKRGVELLRAATPSDSGETAASWKYEIEKRDGKVFLYFTNDHENNGVNIVKLLVFGHGLWNGGYVAGNDFITPVLNTMLTELANDAWREVTK